MSLVLCKGECIFSGKHNINQQQFRSAFVTSLSPVLWRRERRGMGKYGVTEGELECPRPADWLSGKWKG